MKNFLLNLDYLSSDISLYHDKEIRHKGVVGGILTVIMVAISLAVSIYFCTDFLEKKNPKAYLVNRYVDDVGTVTTNKTQMFNTLNVNKLPELVPMPWDKRALSPVSIVQFNNGSLIAKYYYEYCEYGKDMKGLEEYFPIDMKSVIESTYLCKAYLIDANGKKVMRDDPEFVYPYMAHGMSSQTKHEIDFITLVERCANSTDSNITCLSDEEIDSYYTNILFSFRFIDNYVDISNYTTPVRRFLNKIEGMLNPSSIDLNYLTFSAINIITHDGILFDSQKEQSTYKYDYRVESINPRNGDSKVFQINCGLQNMEDTYDRSYTRLQDVAANIGGIVKFIYVIAAFINYFPNQFQVVRDYSNCLENKVFFQHSQKQKNFKDFNSENVSSVVHIKGNAPIRTQTIRNYALPEFNTGAHISRSNLEKIIYKKIHIKERFFGYLFKKIFPCNFATKFNILPENEKFTTVLNLRESFLDEKNLVNMTLDIIKIKKLILKDNNILEEFKKIKVINTDFDWESKED